MENYHQLLRLTMEQGVDQYNTRTNKLCRALVGHQVQYDLRQGFPALTTRKLPFKVAIDNTGAVAKAWGDVRLTPTTYIVNKRGEIVKSYVGAPDFPALHQLIEKLLAES